MAQIVRLGPEYFPLTDKGVPVSGGSIYVGTPDLDPEILANQIQLSVQKEDGDIIAVSQPISTSAGGIPLYNGSPVTLIVDEAYSLKVLDSLGAQVYYVPENLKSSVFVADEFIIQDPDDPTKQIDFDASNITTGNTRTIVMPDGDVDFTDLKLYSPLDSNSHQIQASYGADVASASELPVLTDGNTSTVTGTTNIDTIVDIAIGTKITLVHAGILDLVQSVSLLLKNGGDNITTAVGDVSTWYQKEATVWEMTGYIKADGTAPSITLGTPIAATSGTIINVASLPENIKELKIMLRAVVMSGTSDLLVQLRDSGGLEVSGYVSSGSQIGGAPNTESSTSGFIIDAGAAVHTVTCNMNINLENSSTFSWVADHAGKVTTTGTLVGGGDKSLSGVLDGFSVTTVGGATTFVSGEINYSYKI